MDALSRLQGIPFFSHLTPEQAVTVAAGFHAVRFVPGDEILEQGHVTDHFFIVDEGFVNVRHTDPQGVEKAVGSKSPGEYFGIKMFTTQELSDFTFEAVSAATLWVMDRKDWDVLLNTHPDLLENMPELRVEYARLARGLNWLSPGEVIDVMVHRHWWALFLMIRLPVFAILIFTAAFLASIRFGIVDRLPWVVLVYGATLVLGLLWLGWNALNWWNDLYIVTNKRAMRINRVLFFSDSREEVVIEKIQAQKVVRGGPISVFFNISDLRLTSAAGEEGGLVFEQVANVERIQRAIAGEQMKAIERRSAAQREKARALIASDIHHYVFQEPSPFEPPRVAFVRVSLTSRIKAVLNWALGTEIRENRVVTWRKHHLVLLGQIGVPLGIFLALLLLTIAVSIYGTALELVRNGVYVGLGLLMILAFGAVVWQWLDWQVDLYRLTETQIIDIESLPFGLRYSENRADLSKIQDVNNARAGIINTLFDYGDVVARVAGNADPFTFFSVPKPSVVADEISERIVMIAVHNAERATREQTRSIVDAIVAYHRLVAAERNQHGAPNPTILVSPPPQPTPEAASLFPGTPIAHLESEFPPESSDDFASTTESEFPPEADLTF